MGGIETRGRGLSRVDGFRRASEGYLDMLAANGYAEKTLRDYRYALTRAHRALRTLGTPPSPIRFKEAHKRAVFAAVKHDSWLVKELNVCLRALKVKTEFLLPAVPIPPRRVRWLTKDQAERMEEAAQALGPPYSTVVHLELQNGFRRISVIRARVRDLQANPIVVRGKGTDYNMVPHVDIARILSETMDWRGRRRYISEWLLPARSHRYEHHRSEGGLDLLLEKVAVVAKVHCSHHDLRRTFARNLWEAGVRIEVIAAQLGHRSIEMTRQYLGINLTDQKEAMLLLAKWESEG